MSVWVCTYRYRHPQKPEKGVRSPEAGVTAGCELPDIGSNNQTQVFCRSTTCLYHWCRIPLSGPLFSRVF